MKSQALPEIPLMGLIAVATIMAGIVIPTSIVKITIDKDLAFTHKYEKSQQILLTLLSSTHGEENIYEMLSHKAFFEAYACRTDESIEGGPNPACPVGYTCIPYGNRPVGICSGLSTDSINTKLAISFNFDNRNPNLQNPGYCISSRDITAQQSLKQPISARLTSKGVEDASTQVVKRQSGCAITDSVFDTIIVVPYNKDSLIKLLRVAV